jgi:hypothetical protein
MIFVFRFAFSDAQTITAEEQTWFIVGERISKGDLPYADIWETLPFLSACTYALLWTIFGASKTALLITGNLLFFVQCLLVARTMSRREILHEKNHIPLLVFAVFSQFSTACFVLSPQMMSLTAMLPAYDIILRSDKESNDFELLKIGFWAAVAALFDGLMTFSLLWFGFAVSNFRGMSPRHFSIIAYGFLLPFVLVFLLYVQADKEFFLFEHYFSPLFGTIWHLNLVNIPFFLTMLFLTLPIFAAIFKILIQRSLTSYQGSVFFVLIFWLAWVGIFMLSESFQKPLNLLYAAFPSTFLIPKWLMFIRKKVWKEIAFLFFMLGVAAPFWAELKNPLGEKNAFGAKKIVATQFEGKKIVVLGNNQNYYFNNTLVSPFLNWELSKNYWDRSDTYEVIAEIVKIFTRERPEVVIDEEGYFAKFLIRAPVIAKMYKETEKGIFLLQSET